MLHNLPVYSLFFGSLCFAHHGLADDPVIRAATIDGRVASGEQAAFLGEGMRGANVRIFDLPDKQQAVVRIYADIGRTADLPTELEAAMEYLRLRQISAKALLPDNVTWEVAALPGDQEWRIFRSLAEKDAALAKIRADKAAKDQAEKDRANRKSWYKWGLFGITAGGGVIALLLLWLKDS